MCYHTSVGATYKQLEMEYDRPFEGDFPSFINPNEIIAYHLNGFDFPNLPIITCENPKIFQFFKWGLIPSWMNTFENADSFRVNTLNAKSETIFEKVTFKSNILKRRCLIPATGFFEWKQESTRTKIPYFIYKESQPIFSFAGIYDYWINPAENRMYKTFSIITLTANPFMREIHNTKKRMPLILSKDQESIWINSNSKIGDIKACFEPQETNFLNAHTISKLITSKKESSNVAEVIMPFHYPKSDLFS